MVDQIETLQTATLSRRLFLGAGGVALPALLAVSSGSQGFGQEATAPTADRIVTPPEGKPILVSCKLGMIAKEVKGKKLTVVERLLLAKEAGFDGVDFDEAGGYTPAQARAAVQESGVFVHNAINHAHWSQRLTSPKPEERDTGRGNIEHCIRVSHAAGGSGVLIVIGHGKDGTVEETESRAREEIKKLLPLAAALGQRILFENVWNHMQYDHDKPPEQSAERFVKFVDSFDSPWVGMYYDIGNHWKYGQPAEWIRAFGSRCVKLDIKGFSRAKDSFADITQGDLPWDEVREGPKAIGFTGWATAEVGGGGLERLQTVCEQMRQALIG